MVLRLRGGVLHLLLLVCDHTQHSGNLATEEAMFKLETYRRKLMIDQNSREKLNIP